MNVTRTIAAAILVAAILPTNSCADILIGSFSTDLTNDFSTGNGDLLHGLKDGDVIPFLDTVSGDTLSMLVSEIGAGGETSVSATSGLGINSSAGISADFFEPGEYLEFSWNGPLRLDAIDLRSLDGGDQFLIWSPSFFGLSILPGNPGVVFNSSYSVGGRQGGALIITDQGTDDLFESTDFDNDLTGNDLIIAADSIVRLELLSGAGTTASIGGLRFTQPTLTVAVPEPGAFSGALLACLALFRNAIRRDRRLHLLRMTRSRCSTACTRDQFGPQS